MVFQGAANANLSSEEANQPLPLRPTGASGATNASANRLGREPNRTLTDHSSDETELRPVRHNVGIQPPPVAVGWNDGLALLLPIPMRSFALPMPSMRSAGHNTKGEKLATAKPAPPPGTVDATTRANR